MINNFIELLAAAQKTPPVFVSVAKADEPETLKAVIRAREMGISVPILSGNRG
ncbi:MAG: hypothetical protein JW901_05965 [Dehalococcoidia bacterium]|nr:hypothetical protein [Dehalococcoidia bacterium]